MGRTLVVFARAPQHGKVKTRIARELGDDFALALYRACLSDCLAVATSAARTLDAELVVAVAGEGHVHDAQVAQPEGDLGVKMASFIDRHVARGPVCIIGSDSPTLRPEHVVRAFEALHDHDVVLGPSVDGGYWLIGARRPIPELFSDIAWSTPTVLDETLRRLRGRSVALVDFYYDVDEPADLERLRAHLGVLPTEVAPATRKVLCV